MKKFAIGFGVCLVLLIGMILFIGGGEETNTGTLTVRLQNASECTTQKFIYQGVVEKKNGFMPIINKKSFLMTYKATVRAGFDMKNLKVNVDEENYKITITIPKTSIQDINVDVDSLEFYDTSFAIISPDGKEAAKEAQQEAIKDAKAKAGDSGLLEAADENAEALIKGMLSDLSEDYEITIKHQKS